MKAAFQLLFLLFYVASSLTATHINTLRVVRDILRFISTSDDVRTLDHSAKVNRSLARYRDAKKSTNDIQYRNVEIADLVLTTTADTLVAADGFLKLQLRVDRYHSRAPPILS